MNHPFSMPQTASEAMNSKAYWESRFATDWEVNGGPEQSRFFSRLAVKHMPGWLTFLIKSESLSMCDWGCAQGDGTDMLGQLLDGARITGVDFSVEAIERAKRAYPAHSFHAEDFLASENASEVPDQYDILFSSNTLEHFHAPHKVLNMLARRAKRFLVLLLPFREYERIDEHFSTFDFSNIRLALPGWSLAHAAAFDAANEQPTYWAAEQILLVYARHEELEKSGLSLGDACLDTQASDAKITELVRDNSEHVRQLAERDSQLAQREALLAGHAQQQVQLDAQISARNQQLEQRNALLSERDGQLAELRQAMAQLNATLTQQAAQYQALLAAHDKTIDRKFNALTGKTRTRLSARLALASAFYRVTREQGLRHAVDKAKQRIMRRANQPRDIAQLATTDQERYLMGRTAQSNYIGHYIQHGFEPQHLALFKQALLKKIPDKERVVIYPLSYPRELTQRPDHVLRDLAAHGYTCIILSLDNKAPFVEEISHGVFLTNLLATVVSWFSGRTPVFYITYPFFSYFVDHMPGSIVVYDTLDDLSVYSLYCDAMIKDHQNLLARSDVSLFSSKVLQDANTSEEVNDSYLVTNGVWVQDFHVPVQGQGAALAFKKPEGKTVIGYHGAISELLDWELLEKILQDKRVCLVLIGPVTQFADTVSSGDASVQKRVLTHPQLIHIPTVPYADLKHYLHQFDAGIVPFIVNEKTHPVSPLKLFEYMAVGLKIFATPTKTLSSYGDAIVVEHRSMLPQRISHWITQSMVQGSAAQAPDYADILDTVDWGRQLDPVRRKIDALLADQTPRKAGARRVDIINVNFFDWDGKTLYKGGAERYVFDLACLLRERGWSPRILQNANHPFEIDFRGIAVVGVQTHCGHDLRGMSKKYREVCAGADLIVASPLDLACELSGMNVIGINHGIYWDHKYKSLSNTNIAEYKNLFDALQAVDGCVCVDTNFINWVRTYDYAFGNKLRYVPNYFDRAVFAPVDKDFSGRLRILYPRRLYEARGIFLVLKAFTHLFEQYPEIELHLVGQANAEDGEVVAAFAARYPGRVIWEEFDMGDMHQVYRHSHIVLVPTMYSEGTSLSCLEAMATNNAVIATHIGGLPNLIIDGFNGCLIDPKPEALVEAIESLLLNRQLIADMAAKGGQLVEVFEKNRWAARWQHVLSEVNA